MIVERSVDPGSQTPFAFARFPGPYNKRPVSAVVKVADPALGSKIGPAHINLIDNRDPYVYVLIKNIQPNETVQFQLKINYGTTPAGQPIELIEDVKITGNPMAELPYSIEAGVLLGGGTLTGGSGGQLGEPTLVQPGIVLATGSLAGGGGGLAQAIIVQAGTVVGSGTLTGGAGGTAQAVIVPPGTVLGVATLTGGSGATASAVVAATTPTPILVLPESDTEGYSVIGQVIKSDGLSFAVGTTWQYRQDGGSWTAVSGSTPVRISGNVVTFDLPLTAGDVDQVHTVQLRGTEPGKDQSAGSNTANITALAVKLTVPLPSYQTVQAASANAPIGGVSLFRENSSYTGACIRVQRSSDNTQQDIGFTGDNELDVAALMSFVGSSDGIIHTWYDQSGNGKNGTIPASAQGPRIVIGGVLQVDEAGNPKINFVGSRQLTFGTGWNVGSAGMTLTILEVPNTNIETAPVPNVPDALSTSNAQPAIKHLLTLANGTNDRIEINHFRQYASPTIGRTGIRYVVTGNSTTPLTARCEQDLKANFQALLSATLYEGQTTANTVTLYQNGIKQNNVNGPATPQQPSAITSAWEMRCGVTRTGTSTWGILSGGDSDFSLQAIFVQAAHTRAQQFAVSRAIFNKYARKRLGGKANKITTAAPVCTLDFQNYAANSLTSRQGLAFTFKGRSWAVSNTNEGLAGLRQPWLNSARIASAAWSGGVATISTQLAHYLQVGDSVVVSGITGATAFNGTVTVTAVTSTTFSYALASNPGTANANTGVFYLADFIGAGIDHYFQSDSLPFTVDREFTLVSLVTIPSTVLAGDIYDFLGFGTKTGTSVAGAGLEGKDHGTGVAWFTDLVNRSSLNNGGEDFPGFKANSNHWLYLMLDQHISPNDGGKMFSVTNVSRTSNTVTLTTSSPHGLGSGQVGKKFFVRGIAPYSIFSGEQTIASASGSTITYTVTTAGTPAIDTSYGGPALAEYLGKTGLDVIPDGHVNWYYQKLHMLYYATVDKRQAFNAWNTSWPNETPLVMIVRYKAHPNWTSGGLNQWTRSNKGIIELAPLNDLGGIGRNFGQKSATENAEAFQPTAGFRLMSDVGELLSAFDGWRHKSLVFNKCLTDAEVQALYYGILTV